jgi:hypothetical protein
VCGLDDDTVPVFALRSIPIRVRSAIIDGVQCTQKMRMLLEFYWDHDIEGVLFSDLDPLQGRRLVVSFDMLRKQNIARSGKLDIVRKGNTGTCNGKSILFNELIF